MNIHIYTDTKDTHVEEALNERKKKRSCWPMLENRRLNTCLKDNT